MSTYLLNFIKMEKKIMKKQKKNIFNIKFKTNK